MSRKELREGGGPEGCPDTAQARPAATHLKLSDPLTPAAHCRPAAHHLRVGECSPALVELSDLAPLSHRGSERGAEAMGSNVLFSFGVIADVQAADKVWERLGGVSRTRS